MQHFAKTLRSFVAANRAKLALAVLNDFLPNQMPQLHDEALLLQANLAQAESDFATGVADRREVQQSVARVNAGLLRLIGEVARHAGDEAAALARARQIEAGFDEQEFAPRRLRGFSPWIWVSGAAAAVLAGFLTWKTVASPEEPPRAIKSQPEQVEKPKSIAEQQAEHRAWLQKARDFAAQGQWEKALETVNKGFGLGFDNAEIFNERADILIHLARFTEARDDARRAIALDPNNCLPYMSLAQALSKLGDTEGFYSNLETALRKHCKVWKYTQQPGLFEYRNAARFKKLMRQYQE